MQENLHGGTSCVMRNLLHNAMQSRYNEPDIGVMRWPSFYCDRMKRDMPAIDTEPTRLKGVSLVRGNDEGNFNHRYFGAKKRDFDEASYASFEIRQNTWGYSKRKKELREPINTEESFVAMKRTPFKNEEIRGRGRRQISSGLNSIKEDKLYVINGNTLTKRTRFNEDVEILEQENKNAQLKGKESLISKCNKSTARSIEIQVQNRSDTEESSRKNEETCLKAVPTQKELEDKILDLYQNIITFKTHSVGNISEVSSEKLATDQKENKSILKRRKHLLSMGKKAREQLPDARRNKNEEVAKQSAVSKRKQLLKEYDSIMQERLNEAVQKLIESKDNNTNNKPSKDVGSEKGEPADAPMKKYLEIELSSLYVEDKENDLPVTDEPKHLLTLEKSPSTLENNAEEKETDISEDSSRSSVVSITFNEDCTWNEGENKTKQDLKDEARYENFERKPLKRELRRCQPVTQFQKDSSWGSDGGILRNVLGCSKSLPSSASPSKLVTRKNVKCILRRSPPGLSLRRIESRRRHTHTITRKMVSHSEVISHSAHSDHYYTRRDSASQLKHLKRRNKTTYGTQREQSGVYESLKSESFSSSFRISHLEHDLSYETDEKSELEEILPPKVVKKKNASNISYHDEIKKLLRSDAFSAYDIKKCISTGKLTHTTNKKKNLVLETFRDVLYYVKPKKRPKQLIDTEIAHDTISPFSMNDQKHVVKSTGVQVLESFCELVRYLRDINAAAANGTFPLSHLHDNVVFPSPDGDAKECVRVPFKFSTPKKYNSTHGGGWLVLEAFREVLKLMKEEDDNEVKRRRFSRTSFSPGQQESYVFFEMRNQNMYSDGELRMNVTEGDCSKVPRHAGTTGGEPEHTFNTDKSADSTDECQLCTSKPQHDLNGLPRGTCDENKESVVPILRQLFHHPVFDSFKKSIKDTNSRKKRRRTTPRAQENSDNVENNDIKSNPNDNCSTEERKSCLRNDKKLNNHISENIAENLKKANTEKIEVKTNEEKDVPKFCTYTLKKRRSCQSNAESFSNEKENVVHDTTVNFNTKFENKNNGQNECNIVKRKELLKKVKSDIFPRIISSEKMCPFNKDNEISRESQNIPIRRDPSQKKLARNAKALEKIASERYCYLRPRADVQKQEES